MKRVLVIKLGALGDFVLAFGPFAAIRAHHPAAAITLLTTAPFAELARASPWFDAVMTDERPAWWRVGQLIRLGSSLRGFDMVYDLQTSGRSGWYHRLAGRPRWSGIADGCSHPHTNPGRDRLHTIERQAEQLRAAGIAAVPAPDLAWLANAAAPPVAEPFTILVPGAAAHRPAKRWPVERFASLAAQSCQAGQTAIVVGGPQDTSLAASIRAAAPSVTDLTGRTTLQQLAALAARARVVVGNDTGPMHLAAAMGAPCVVLFSRHSDPALTQPRGRVRVLRAADLADLSVQRVAEALAAVQ